MIKRFRTIRVRLTLWYTLLLGLILIGFSGLLYAMLAHALAQQTDETLQIAAEQAKDAIEMEKGRLTLDLRDSQVAALTQHGLLVRVINLGGQVEASNDSAFATLPVVDGMLIAARQEQPRFDTVSTSGAAMPVRLYSVPFQKEGTIAAVVQVGQSLQFSQDVLRQLAAILLLALPLTLLSASLGGLFLAHRALSPIDRITRAARRIGAENLSERLALTLPDDEVGRLAQTFDSMLARLDGAFRRQRQFTADASHELRTPLTVMKGDISVALNRPRQADEYREVLSELEEEVDRLTRLVEDLLFLARADSHQPLLHTAPLDLADLIPAVVDQVRPLSDAKGLTVGLTAPASLPLIGDQDKLYWLFLNLMDNAVKFTPPGGCITIRCESAWHPPVREAHATPDGAGSTVVVSIADNGPGIPPEHLPHLFDRFYRVDGARSRAAGGTGLGLSIAREIAEAHGGGIEVESQVGQGSVFTAWLSGSPE